jgi:hypothetical protein
VARKPRSSEGRGTTPAARSAPAGADFNPDYTYVRADLRRIAVLAVSFFSFLIVLAFLLR